jgi:uncharacterized membrane protein
MDSYNLLKTLHLFGVVLFLGNIVVTAWWKLAADRTRDPGVIAFAQRQVTLTDWIFTLGGAILVAAGGIGNALAHGIPMSTGWIHLGSMSFGVAALIWLAVLVPLQTRLARLARRFAVAGDIPEEYWRLERYWGLAGSLVTVLLLANVPIMVFKWG